MTARRRRRRRKSDDEERVGPRPVGRQNKQSGVMALQHHIGNRAVQRLLAQRQAQQEAAAPVEVGQIKIEPPQIEHYEVSGNSLPEVTGQLLPPEQWYKFDYRHRPTVENGVVTRVDVTVTVTLRLPRWVGPGWEQAPEGHKVAWLGMLKELAGNNESVEEMGMLPGQWVGINWDDAPPTMQSQWRAMLQEMQIGEQTLVDLVKRRVLVLQQRMLNRPEEAVNKIFEQFQRDVEIEEEAYNKQREFGQNRQITLGTDAMMQ